MNQVDQNINKDMFDSDLIDVDSLDLSDDQTWLITVPDDSGQHIDIVDWNLSLDWPSNDDNEYLSLEKELYKVLDNILKEENLTCFPDKHKVDSRTFVRPKKRIQRPTIQNIMETVSNPPSMSLNSSLNQSANKYLTYNKYNNPLGPISPMLRLKTFNVDTNSDNSTVVKEYALKRKSLVQDDDPQLEDLEVTLASGRSSMDHTPSKPINIDLSQPAHNLHNTFNKGLTSILNERGSLNMYQSGESLMRMSPPSLVSSLLMESSGTFNTESIDSRRSFPHKEPVPPMSGRDSIDPMMTSMTLSILDEKDMSTSFLSQTTYPDNDSLIDSLPPSLVSSVNSSYVHNSTTSKAKDNSDNIFSSATYTNLEQSQKLLSGRPRCTLYNSFTRRDPAIKNSESYTKAREEACQIDTGKILNENCDNKDSPRSTPKPNCEATETISYYSNNRFQKDNDAEKENFEIDDAFYKDVAAQKPEELGRNSLNVTMGKQELNEIIQARQKLSLARKGLPSESDKAVPKTDTSPIKTIQLPNQTITVPRQSIENASELLSRRRALNTNGNCLDRSPEEPIREAPKRNATFKKLSPRASAMDTTVVYVKTDDNNIIDINSATLNLIDSSEKLPRDARDWGSQETAMVGSCESTDTGTFSSSSPPDSVPDSVPTHNPRSQIASTPLMSLRKGAKNELLDLHNTISPIYDAIDDKSYDTSKIGSNATVMERTFDMHNTTIISSPTIVKKVLVKRDILAPQTSRQPPTRTASPEKKPVGVLQGVKSPSISRTSSSSTVSYGNMIPPSHMNPPSGMPRKTGLPTSKLRQYSSHRDLSRIPPAQPVSGVAVASRGLPVGGRTMVRRGVYASNPALSPTATTSPPVVTESYTIATYQRADNRGKPEVTAPPALVRQGTETLRRERPVSQLVAPRDLRGPGSSVPVPPMRAQYIPPPTSRPSAALNSMCRVPSRPASVSSQKDAPPPVLDQPRPSSCEARTSALPRPSRLPAPRRALRPPSVYSVAPAGEVDHY